MSDARGPEWTDLLGDLLPIVITVVIGFLAVSRRVIEAMFRRRAEAAQGKPRPPLNEEVRQFLEMLDRDTGRGGAKTEAADESREPEEAPNATAWEPEPRPAPVPVQMVSYAPPASAPTGLSVAPALAVSRSIADASRRPSAWAGLGRAGAGIDLRQAIIWSEILAPPLADRPPRA